MSEESEKKEKQANDNCRQKGLSVDLISDFLETTDKKTREDDKLSTFSKSYNDSFSVKSAIKDIY